LRNIELKTFAKLLRIVVYKLIAKNKFTNVCIPSFWCCKKI